MFDNIETHANAWHNLDYNMMAVFWDDVWSVIRKRNMPNYIYIKETVSADF